MIPSKERAKWVDNNVSLQPLHLPPHLTISIVNLNSKQYIPFVGATSLTYRSLKSFVWFVIGIPKYPVALCSTHQYPPLSHSREWTYLQDVSLGFSVGCGSLDKAVTMDHRKSILPPLLHCLSPPWRLQQLPIDPSERIEKLECRIREVHNKVIDEVSFRTFDDGDGSGEGTVGVGLTSYAGGFGSGFRWDGNGIGGEGEVEEVEDGLTHKVSPVFVCTSNCLFHLVIESVSIGLKRGRWDSLCSSWRSQRGTMHSQDSDRSRVHHIPSSLLGLRTVQLLRMHRIQRRCA